MYFNYPKLAFSCFNLVSEEEQMDLKHLPVEVSAVDNHLKATFFRFCLELCSSWNVIPKYWASSSCLGKAWSLFRCFWLLESKAFILVVTYGFRKCNCWLQFLKWLALIPQTNANMAVYSHTNSVEEKWAIIASVVKREFKSSQLFRSLSQK